MNVSTPQTATADCAPRRRGERQQRDRVAVPRQPAGGVPALGEGDEELRLDDGTDLGRRRGGDRPALGLRRGQQLRRGRSRPFSAASMIRPIVPTASTGYFPTLVSADSISASAPSSTALAASEASARVGRGLVDHRLQHLRGDDHRLGLSPGERDRPLLHQRHVLERQLDAEVTAGDHQPVEGADDLFEVVDRLRLLQLGEHRQPHTLLVHDRVDGVEVVGAAHERQRDHVGPQPQAPSAGPRRPCRTARAPRAPRPARSGPCGR